ncbi:MAG: hypothetical protein H6760_00060 [Candidatus Nomurabacteria bacterium]|nr:MAG: hypothetical protein H6760_00060 [Candidatus Nomurabacteria bacterium]
MEISYIVLFYIYVGLVGLYVLFAFFDLFHVVRFGMWNFTTTTVTFLFIAGSVLILFVSFQWLSQVDWTQVITLRLNN